MFNLFGRKDEHQPTPPTPKQLAYAQKLKIPNASSLSREELSLRISEIEAENPRLERQREKVRKAIEAKEQQELATRCGPEMMAALKQWESFVADEPYILAIFRRRESIIVDVLQVYDSYITGKKNPKLCIRAVEPKAKKDKDFGYYLEWEKEFELDTKDLLYSERLPADFDDFEPEEYRRVVERGLALAKKMKL